jgi:hypothetical protein
MKEPSAGAVASGTVLDVLRVNIRDGFLPLFPETLVNVFVLHFWRTPAY